MGKWCKIKCVISCEWVRAVLLDGVSDDAESAHEHVGEEGEDDGKELDGLDFDRGLVLQPSFFDDGLEHRWVRHLVGMNHW
ncbi:hypothetical protein AAHA92_10674 [Salvia divinorum]|uniref:Uncharacterized protein n=1 Tax=Salvia divinorum TaxID=28513 RepID=A0ABD1HVK4_SALDI